MSVAVIDAGVAIGWIQGRQRSRAKLDRLFRACRDGRTQLVISVVNLAEVLIHTADLSRETGVDVVGLLTASRVRTHPPDEAIARRVASLGTSLADGFAAATAQELGVRLHTTDAELVRQRSARLPITHHWPLPRCGRAQIPGLRSVAWADHRRGRPHSTTTSAS